MGKLKDAIKDNYIAKTFCDLLGLDEQIEQAESIIDVLAEDETLLELASSNNVFDTNLFSLTSLMSVKDKLSGLAEAAESAMVKVRDCLPNLGGNDD